MKKMASMLGIVACIWLAGFSSTTSVSDDSKTNYFGTLNGQEVEHITISGLTDHIFFYNKPKIDASTEMDKIDPKHDRTEKSLAEIKTIKLPHGKRIFSKYRNQEYIEVILVDQSGSEGTYLVEKNRMVTGKLPKGAGKRDVFFDALDAVEVKGAVCAGKPAGF